MFLLVLNLNLFFLFSFIFHNFINFLIKASSPPVTEAHLCDADMAATDDYIQEPDETMVRQFKLL